MPEACAGELRHANAVPGIRERRDRAHRRRPELPLRCFQISGRLVGIGGNAGAAARTDRNTAGHGLLLENDDACARIMGSMAAMAPAKPKPTTTTSKVSVIKKNLVIRNGTGRTRLTRCSNKRCSADRISLRDCRIRLYHA